MTIIMTISGFNLHLHPVITYWVANHDLTKIKIYLILFRRFKRFKYLSPSSKSLFRPHRPGVNCNFNMTAPRKLLACGVHQIFSGMFL